MGRMYLLCLKTILEKKEFIVFLALILEVCCSQSASHIAVRRNHFRHVQILVLHFALGVFNICKYVFYFYDSVESVLLRLARRLL
jgi:hypothetical protein